ncbi:hypothetical protein XAP412_540021 [Xanthomonas phaseoli pv. phaseoli]|uniref:Uncharacterized protein n=1 Tax=Xanthomonas campestris pv. phaseoli TaxID=317013 RepID=A0AB38E511_XANCH|nr:hypothetical protein XAP6984_590022 [Xanthomonas phaseoli pv. phaseoli]SON87588.1 hypothetical protein XAP412_540021 [Xanthomonas phaseoli pv. phaseoli]SON91371.1 hypothetical protein XAP7430_550022 [Xanthomonas phaseoli pv. phaseoli]SOO28599.1 hypothetical protein XAP6164_2570007 [Xanthomonas phaseoli pv. phaseoli]
MEVLRHARGVRHGRSAMRAPGRSGLDMGTEQATVGAAILGAHGGSTVRHWGADISNAAAVSHA